MTTETLSSSDDDGPRRRPPRWAVVVAAAAVVLAAVVGLVVQHQRAAHRHALRLAALDDVNVNPTITGGGTGPAGVMLEVALLNSGRYPIVVGTASVTAPGVSVEGSTLAGRPIPSGAVLNDEVQLRVSCPTAADAKTLGDLLIGFTSAAHRRHVLRLPLGPRPNAPDGEPMHIIRSQCGALDAGEATTLGVLQFVSHSRQVDIAAELTNSGRSRLTVLAIGLGDDRLHLVVSPQLPLSLEPRGRLRIRLRVSVAQCGPEVSHEGRTLSVESTNEFGDSVGNSSDDELDRAFRELVAEHCPQG